MKKQALVLLACFLLLAYSASDTVAQSSKTQAGSISLKQRNLILKPLHTEIGVGADLAYIVVKFTDESKVRKAIGKGGSPLVSLGNRSIAETEVVLKNYLQASKMNPVFTAPVAELDSQREKLQLTSGMSLADMAGYYQIEITDPKEAMIVIDKLNALDIVEIAYPMPKPQLAVAEVITPNFVGSQTYLDPAPDGVDADYAFSLSGGDGTGIKVIDVEGAWLTGHEDLTANSPTSAFGGMIGDQGWRDHGTAVVGEMIGSDNGLGIRGIAPGLEWGYSSIAATSAANAINVAANALSPGDLILIELHAPGPKHNFVDIGGQLGFVAMEFFSAEFTSIRNASLSGIIVCEAAGNGAEDFDDALYTNVFDTTFRNSFAIMCGAGAPPSGAFGIDRSRLGFSNYGERVNLQGYGNGVVTTGYGGLHVGGGETQWYTAGFSGTSSASPIVTAAIACLQSIYKTNYGSVLTADEIRTIMTNTGSPQQANSFQHIGPRPDLFAAFNEVLGAVFSADTAFGNVPLPVQFTGMSAKTVTSWLWDFGDNSSSSAQSPSHTYTSPGVYSITLAVQTTEGDFSTIRSEYIVALADTVVAQDAEGGDGGFARVDIYAHNTLPLRRIIIPIEWSGPFGLSYDSAVTTGLRTEYFEVQNWLEFNSFTDQGVYELASSNSGTSPDLPADTGAIISVYFNIPGGASGGPNNILILPSHAGRPLQFVGRRQGASIVYSPLSESGSVSICARAGDADGNNELNISDATFIVLYIFQGGTEPMPVKLADANCDATVDISDATSLINFIFNQGPAPCACAPKQL